MILRSPAENENGPGHKRHKLQFVTPERFCRGSIRNTLWIPAKIMRE